jgi:hypothetical protein
MKQWMSLKPGRDFVLRLDWIIIPFSADLRRKFAISRSQQKSLLIPEFEIEYMQYQIPWSRDPGIVVPITNQKNI